MVFHILTSSFWLKSFKKPLPVWIYRQSFFKVFISKTFRYNVILISGNGISIFATLVRQNVAFFRLF